MPFPIAIKRALSAILGERWVKDDPVSLYSYACDALTLYTSPPMGVVYPATRDELVQVVKLLSAHGISFVPRGAGTGLSGGAVPRTGGVVIEMVRFKRIMDLDPVNRTITVEPGVVNLDVSEHTKPFGLYFVPDPSSQRACSVGGNVAENSGGPHTLKYGVTVNHVLGLEVVLPDGEVVELGANHWGCPGPDLVGLFVGSEGTFGIVTKIVCRLTPLPERAVTLLAAFQSVRDACEAVSGIIRHGVLPAALEMIDRVVIQAIEKSTPAGLPQNAEAVLIVELEDLSDGLDHDAGTVEAILRAFHATEVRRALDDAERAAIWRARKGAFGAIGSICPSYYTQDGVIPRSALPEVLEKVLAVGQSLNLTIANVFHAGDGNLHPLILYDAEDPDSVENTHQAGQRILGICLAYGGALSGEHGIGFEKAELMSAVYAEADLENMKRVRDVFNPLGLLNPGKVFATPSRCAEVKLVPKKSGIVV
jgi:glycolate oxidase